MGCVRCVSEGQMGRHFDVEGTFQSQWPCLLAFRINHVPLKKRELCDVFAWFKLFQSFLGGAIFAIQITPTVFTASAFRLEVVFDCRNMVGNEFKKSHQFGHILLVACFKRFPLFDAFLLELGHLLLVAALKEQLLIFGDVLVRTREGGYRVGDAVGVVCLLAEDLGGVFLVEGLREGHGRPADEVVLVCLDFGHDYIIGCPPPAIIGSVIRNARQQTQSVARWSVINGRKHRWTKRREVGRLMRNAYKNI